MINELMEVTEYAIIKFKDATANGYKCSDELAKKILQRNYQLGITIKKGDIIETRQYKNLFIKADNKTKKIVGLETIKDNKFNFDNSNIKSKLNKLLNIVDMEKNEGIRETLETKGLYNLNKTAFVTMFKILKTYDLTYIKCRKIITEKIKQGKEIACIDGIKYVSCEGFVAIINVRKNLVQYISYNSEVVA